MAKERCTEHNPIACERIVCRIFLRSNGYLASPDYVIHTDSGKRRDWVVEYATLAKTAMVSSGTYGGTCPPGRILKLGNGFRTEASHAAFNVEKVQHIAVRIQFNAIVFL